MLLSAPLVPDDWFAGGGGDVPSKLILGPVTVGWFGSGGSGGGGGYDVPLKLISSLVTVGWFGSELGGGGGRGNVPSKLNILSAFDGCCGVTGGGGGGGGGAVKLLPSFS